MLQTIHGFIGALRAAGLRISPAESIQALEALQVIDLSRRERVRAALRCSLAKDRLATQTFDQVFERYFRSASHGPHAGRDEQRFAGRSGAGPGELGRKRRPDQPPEPGAGAGRAQEPKQPASSKTAAPEPRSDLGMSERARRQTPAAESQRPGDGALPLPRGPAIEPARRRDLSRSMPSTEEQGLAAELPRLLAELRLRGRRRPAPGRSGRLWVKRLLRANLPHGVPLVLPRQERRPRKPRVVLLVDVSFSVARAAGYFLLLALQLLDRFRDTRIFLFVDRPIDATDRLTRWLEREPVEPALSVPLLRYPGGGIRPAGGASFLELLQSVPGLDLTAPSDYGRALYSLAAGPAKRFRSGTVVVVLGDARTNRYEPLPWALEEIAGRCRRVLWLVPERRAQWGQDDSALFDYAPHVDYVGEAHDLTGLAHGLRELLGI